MSEPDATPRRPPRPRRRTVAALLVGIALVVAVVSVFGFVQSRSPQAVAERYLSHLASGDASAVMELVVPAHPELAGVRDAIAGVQIAPPRLGEVTWVTMYPAVYPVEVVGSEQYKTSVDRIVVGIDSSPEIEVIPAP